MQMCSNWPSRISTKHRSSRGAGSPGRSPGGGSGVGEGGGRGGGGGGAGASSRDGSDGGRWRSDASFGASRVAVGSVSATGDTRCWTSSWGPAVGVVVEAAGAALGSAGDGGGSGTSERVRSGGGAVTSPSGGGGAAIQLLSGSPEGSTRTVAKSVSRLDLDPSSGMIVHCG